MHLPNSYRLSEPVSDSWKEQIALLSEQYLSKGEVDGVFCVYFCWLICFWNSRAFLHDPVIVGNLISGSSAFSKSSLYIWKFSVHVQLKASLKDYEYNLASM